MGAAVTTTPKEKKSKAAESAGPAVPALREALRKERALEKMLLTGPTGLAVCDVRHLSARALGAIGRDARAAIPDLEKAFATGDDLLKTFAAGSLVMLGKESKAVLASLEKSLTAPKSALNVWVAQALGKGGGPHASGLSHIYGDLAVLP